MRYLLKIILSILITGLVFFAYYFIGNFFPWPFNHINIIFIVVILFTVISPQREIFWYYIPLAFLLESFTAKGFGLISLSLLGSLMIIDWFLKKIFTNRSFLIVYLSTAVVILLYRSIFILLLLLTKFLDKAPVNYVGLLEIILNSLMEIFLTPIVTLFIYLIFRLLFKRLGSKYLNTSQSGGMI